MEPVTPPVRDAAIVPTAAPAVADAAPDTVEETAPTEDGELSPRTQAHPAAEPDKASPQTELERKIAALEEMVGRKAEDWDGDTVDTGVDAAFFHRPVEVLDWQDVGTIGVAAEPAAKAAPDPQPAAPAAAKRDRDLWYGEEAATIDEDMLRDMVAEIVRQELQGALGERITRNVRKLVRREIHRVLMSQDFD